MKVRVVNGESLLSEGKCPMVEVKVQNQRFLVKAYLLVLGGCDMVLRV